MLRRMRSQLVAPALARVREAGGDAAALARRHELPAGADEASEVLLPLATLRAFLDDAAAAAGEPALGLRLAQGHRRGLYGVVEYACRSAPSVREAFARIVRYVGLLNELVQVALEERGGVGVVEQRIPGEPLCVGRHGNEFFVATLLLHARALAAVDVVPERVAFAHPAPADTGELRRLLGTDRMEFSAGANRLALASSFLDRPLASADPALLSILDKQAEQALAGLPAASRLLARARQEVRDTLGETPPSLEALARRMGMSARTLQRRLAAEGVSFQDLVEGVRRERALEYVRDARRPLGEVAFLLGYSELSAFLRAFKRWTGRTPGEVRAG